MKLIKTILGHIYFILGMLVFVITMLIVFIPIWITTLMKEPDRTVWLHRIFHVWMGVYLPLIGCPVRRKGKEHFAAGQNYVVVCNHNSLADIPVSSPWIPGANKTLAKIEMARIPIFGVIYKAGSILLDRKNEHSRRESFTQMNDMLQLGLHLCLYPEGTRNKTDKPLQPFYDGAFMTAIRAQKPIIPALIFNTGAILPHNRKIWAWPHRIEIHFLPPIITEGKGMTDVKELKEQVHAIMETYYVAHKKNAS
jgi:1-acyl-sn-glycerol-3-phosphate acyltransferase